MSSFINSDRSGMLRPIALRICFIGVFFHELAHYIMSLVVGKMPDSFTIKWQKKTEQNSGGVYGSISLERPPSFLQTIIISFAPLYISTWLIFLLWFGVIFTPYFSPLVKIIAIFLLISLLLTASPSKGDLQYITHSFRKDPAYSWYQILLICLSILILWLFLIFTQMTFTTYQMKILFLSLLKIMKSFTFTI
ncbi:MAG: metalloprotease family protein [Candidatus Lokiarchaeia archaeon]|nr:metalloprotease family protein [Candidatus Lokiarchaeia archaeon]